MIYNPLPGEYVASAIKRGNESICTNTFSKEDYVIKNIPKKERSQHSDDIIFPKLFIDHGVTREVLYHNTLFPLTIALGRNLTKTMFTPIYSWKICLDCVAENVKIFGTAYIHCSHLLASVRVCSVHGSKLFDRCPTCLKKVTSHKIGKFIKCCNSYQLSPREIGSMKHSYSVFTSELLKYDGRHFETYDVNKAINIKLELMGLLKDDGNYDLLVERMNNQLELSFTSESFYQPSTDVCAASGFLAYQTTDAYLNSLNDKSVWISMLEELRKQ
ncbi:MULTISPECIES: hypothetical protein [Pseudomonas syringae group]|uniref:hypothetical protein n=1 Tax=Pseudomonas syringae group TaxID=136849 RepID=UPI0011C34496|nr:MULTISPECIES: hypothetical protein [Pseudomonas syringae group]